jgi:hypothetical protein
LAAGATEQQGKQQIDETPTGKPGAGSAELNRLWDAFTAARAVAQQSGRLEDRIRTGNSWAAFLELFVRRLTFDRAGVHRSSAPS